MLTDGSEQPRNPDGSPAARHPAWKPHPMQGWSPDFIPKITGDAVTEKLFDQVVTIPGPEAIKSSQALAQEGRHLRRHHLRRHLRRGAQDRRRGAEGLDHPLHAARHRRALPLDAALCRRSGGHDGRGDGALDLDAVRAAAAEARGLSGSVAGLPPAIAAALDARAEGFSRRELAERLARISERYRGQGTSEAITDEADALAYALARMPATYAAISRVLEELSDRAPGWTPGSILDAGAGPGTATWAARELWPEAEAVLLDRNPALLASGRSDLGRGRSDGARKPRRRERRPLPTSSIAGYALTEVPDADLGAVAAWLWAATTGALVIVEPGTPRDYTRLMGVRAALIGAGAEAAGAVPPSRGRARWSPRTGATSPCGSNERAITRR